MNVERNINDMIHFQHRTKSHETRDKIMVEDNLRYVQRWSLFQIVVIIGTTVVQVYFVRKLFDIKNSRPRVWGTTFLSDFILMHGKKFFVFLQREKLPAPFFSPSWETNVFKANFAGEYSIKLFAKRQIRVLRLLWYQKHVSHTMRNFLLNL